MVKIDYVVLAPDQKKEILENNPSSPRPMPQPKNYNDSDNSFKLLYPHSDKKCEKYLFSILWTNLTLLSLLLLFIWLPLLCYAICGGFCTSIDYDSNGIRNMSICGIERPSILFRSSVNTIKYEQYEPLPAHNQCKNIPDSDKFNCFPESNNRWIDEFQCYKRGCCWSVPKNSSLIIPHCFYPSGFRSYEFINDSASDMGAVAYFRLVHNSSYPNNIPVIKIDFNYRTEDILEIKVSFLVESRL